MTGIATFANSSISEDSSNRIERTKHKFIVKLEPKVPNNDYRWVHETRVFNCLKLKNLMKIVQIIQTMQTISNNYQNVSISKI